MTTQELLYPRIKIIENYPGNPQSVGTIIQLYDKESPIVKEQLHYYRTYPHLFEEIEWWQERKVEEMPEYVKYINHREHASCIDCVGKVFRWRNNFAEVFVDYNDNCCATKNFIPATLAEYEAFKATTT